MDVREMLERARRTGGRREIELAIVGIQTVIAFEGGRRAPYARTLDAIRAALESGGVEFTNGDRPGVRLKPKG